MPASGEGGVFAPQRHSYSYKGQENTGIEYVARMEVFLTRSGTVDVRMRIKPRTQRGHLITQPVVQRSLALIYPGSNDQGVHHPSGIFETAQQSPALMTISDPSCTVRTQIKLREIS